MPASRNYRWEFKYFKKYLNLDRYNNEFLLLIYLLQIKFTTKFTKTRSANSDRFFRNQFDADIIFYLFQKPGSPCFHQ